MDPDALEPARPRPQLRDLGPLSVEELREYIVQLDAEILRVRAAIDAKQSVRLGAEALFKK